MDGNAIEWDKENEIVRKMVNLVLGTEMPVSLVS